MDLSFFENDAALVTTVRGTLLLGWGSRQEYACPPDNGIPSFYINDFFLTEARPWVQFGSYIELETLPSAPDNAVDSALHWALPKPDEYQKVVEEVIFCIQKGDFAKGVPYACGYASKTLLPHDLSRILGNVFEYAKSYNSFAYGFWKGGKGMLGATPEQIFTVHGNTLHTIACAGTSSVQEECIDAKIRKEHSYVVEGITDALAEFGSVQRSPSYWKQSGSALYHLVTPLEMVSRTMPWFDLLLRKLHPTAAIGCYPKEDGMKWLRQFDVKIPRKYYGGPIGYRWAEIGEEAAYAAIRSVQWQGSVLELFAGGGVVESSDPASEWQEWSAKFNATRRAVGL